MDSRNEELIYLRKAYRRERRGATGAWKFFFAVSFLVCLVMAPGGLQLLLPGNAVTEWILGGIRFLCGLFGYGDPYSVIPAYSNVFWIVLVLTALVLVVSALMWIFGSRKLRRTDAYLSYRTLRIALRDEKEEQ